MTRLDALVDFYETLTIDDLGRLDTIYAPDVRFKDPFNDVRGVSAIANVFRHMFATVDGPAFVVLTKIADDREAMLRWRFSFATRGYGARAITVHGTTHLRFADDGRVESHHDYWDPATGIYEHLPLLGILMRALRRRLGAPA